MKLLSSASQLVGAQYGELEDFTDSSLDPLLLSYQKGGKGCHKTTSEKISCYPLDNEDGDDDDDDDDRSSVTTEDGTAKSAAFAQMNFINANLASSIDLYYIEEGDDDDFDKSEADIQEVSNDFYENMMYPFEKMERRVKFEVDGNDNIIVHTIRYSSNHEDDDEQGIVESDVYTTSDEQRKSQRQFRRTCRRLLKCNKEMIEQMDCCYAACEDDDTLLSHYLDLCKKWSNSELRGLETTFSNGASEYIRNYVTLVLNYHSELLQLYVLSSSTVSEYNFADVIDLVNEKLRIRIEKESSRSQRFARVLATADAVVV